MQPRPIFLYRRRWTLLFHVPITLLMVACLAYSALLIYTADNRLVTLTGSVGAFASFCIAGTMGRSAWEAYRVREPAVVIDESGITDLREQDSHTVPWEAMERVLLDITENTIRVKLRSSSGAATWCSSWGAWPTMCGRSRPPCTPTTLRQCLEGPHSSRTLRAACLCCVVARDVLWCNADGPLHITQSHQEIP